MRTYANKAVELSPRRVDAYALLARIDLNSGENLDEAESALKKALSLAPGRDDLQMLLAQTFLRADRRDDARTLLAAVERSATNPDVRRQATALLDQTEQTYRFTEIVDAEITKEIAAETAGARTPPRQPEPPAPAPDVPSRRAQETVLELVTPAAPIVEGEKVSGLLTNLDCTAGLTLTVRADGKTLELHSAMPDTIQFLSYTADVSDNVKCGPRNPGTPVTVTYKPVPGGAGEPLVIEFTSK
jgi:hypothetical protein